MDKNGNTNTMRSIVAASAALALWGTDALAEGFQRVEDKGGFISLVKDRELKRLGIRLKVTDDGRIVGRAFGQQVDGAWNWQGGYFCRELVVGGDPFDSNCQTVLVNGRTVRFVSDKGEGIYADLALD